MGTKKAIGEISKSLRQITQLIEKSLISDASPPFDITAADAFIWEGRAQGLRPIGNVNRVGLDLLKGIDNVRDILLENTRQFASGYGANNALLWGARGTGKSSLVKSVHGEIVAKAGLGPKVAGALKLIEIHREDIASLPDLMRQLAKVSQRCIVFCDDLSFDGDDVSYKSLKTALDGGLEGGARNVVFYATSNRRHLMPRDMIENERSSAINPSEAVEEKVSLSDRFGLWLGFHNCDQETYLEIVRAYVSHFSLPGDEGVWRPQALEWSITRGARSGRVAWQFVQDLAGKSGRSLDDV